MKEKSWKKIVRTITADPVREGCCRPHGWRPTTKPNFEIKNTEKGKIARTKESGAGIGLMQVLFKHSGSAS